MQSKENPPSIVGGLVEHSAPSGQASGVHTITGWSLHCTVQAPVQRFSITPPPSAQMVIGEGIPRGGGQSFGDVSLPDQGSALMLESMSEITNFSISEETGVLVCSASATQQQVLQQVVPTGWVLPVVPGASGITVGGAVAADAHGKNHYTQGSIADHIISLKILLPSGDVILVSRSENFDIFWATIGGLGLTGLILQVTLQLRRLASLHVSQTVTTFRSVPEMLDVIETQKDAGECLLGTVDGNFGSNHHWRGVVTSASTCKRAVNDNMVHLPNRRRLSVPRFVTNCSFGTFSTWALNNAIQFRTRFSRNDKIDLDHFLFPQDTLVNWNRLFGRRGFVDYQCCVPIENSLPYLVAVHKFLNQHAVKCFLVAIKRFRRSSNQNPLVFAQEGISIALDMPRHCSTAAQLNALDELAISFGGRINLVKDARLSRKHFGQMYPKNDEWLSVKRRIDPEGRFRSRLSTRLGLNSR